MKQDQKNIIIIILGIAVAVLAVLLWMSYKRKDEHYESANQVATPAPPATASEGPKEAEQPTLALFYADWCPHCKDMKPDWANVHKALEKSPIKIIELEASDPKVAKQGIKGFPTIRFYPQGLNGPFKEHGGGRNTNEILGFLQSA